MSFRGDRPRSDLLARRILGTAALVSGAAVLGILAFVGVFCLPLLSGRSDVLSWDWSPFEGHHGILPMVAGSLALSASALLLALPAGIGICAFAHGLGPGRLGRLVLAVVHLMTGIPTVVYAFASVMLLAPLVRETFRYGNGRCLLTASVVLAVLVLPTIVLLVHAAWVGTAPSLRVTCAALGLSRAQALLGVLLRVSRRGLVAAALLGFARALGDTMIALMLAGNAAQVPDSPLEPFRALTAHIALVVATDSRGAMYASVFAAGLILLLTTAAVSLAARWLAGLAPGSGSNSHATLDR